MANNENLIPQAHKLTVEEQSAGGKASAKARQEKKTMKEAFEVLLELSTKRGEPVKIEEVESLSDLEGKPLTVRDAIVVGMAIKASKGDTRASEFIRDTIGEKPTDKVQVSGLDEEKSKLDELLEQRRMRNESK